MDISFINKLSNNYSALFIVLIDGKKISNFNLDGETLEFVQQFIKQSDFKSKDSTSEVHSFLTKEKKIKKIFIAKAGGLKTISDFEIFSGKKFLEIERFKNKSLSVVVENSKIPGISNEEVCASIASGFNLKNYSFRKYKTIKQKNIPSISDIKVITENPNKVKNIFNELLNISTGVFLTRDLVSEPANILYPEKFVDDCKFLSKLGIKLKIFDEKKIKSLKMDALMGVAQGSVRPPRVLIMEWNGSDSKTTAPLAFAGKGVTFDTGGISIKPSGGMEDMKWDMGGAAVVSGLMCAIAKRKAKVNVVGIVGLVENMPDGNAQRPGDVVKSMSGQTIEVLNTDAEGRLVLADILWYVNKTYKPKLIVDLATLTGAIIVALGDRYGGLFSNDDKLSSQLLSSSLEIKELLWRLPLDEEFDKLLNCNIADMKNITGTRGAGSITAAQFVKRFVGKTKWAHLDIAGVTWSNKGTAVSRSGGTGFGVRLLNHFIKTNYE